jgi:ABC-type transport system substrate-binding protein
VRFIRFSLFLSTLLLAACSGAPLNQPYPEREDHQNILYSSFEARPKHLDPAQSYSSNEITFTGQIYEPPFQYHYLKRPYTLVPLAATAVPKPTYLNAAGEVVPDGPEIATSVYEIRIQPGIRYQPHPAFARDASGRFLYHDLSAAALSRIETLSDFAQTGTRELTADDYVYEIKRLAHPKIQSPIYGFMAEYIVGLKALAAALETAAASSEAALDLNAFPLAGAQVVDRYTYRIQVVGKYPQFIYWLAMPFFAPIPHEADRFYAQPGLIEKNITLDWYPVGTGPYMLTVNDPNRKMVMVKNPNFHGETYPTEGEATDGPDGLLTDAGRPLPLIDQVIFSLEKEDIPVWNKFLQGYYDASGVSSDSFDQVVKIGAGGEADLTEEMRDRGIRLRTGTATTTFYTGFNMLDPVVGGSAESARKLRQAISIAIDEEESIAIFANGRGIAMQGPIPPGIFGFVEGETGINPVVYDWVDGKPRRKAIEQARKLLAEAGYPDGRDAKTGAPLVLHFDTAGTGPEAKASLDWLRKQFEKLHISLVIRSTDYNRFQDKMSKGMSQIFQWGWNADYPDPENFLFLLYGPNAKAGQNGENAANYANPAFDRLFEQMKDLENGTERQALIHQMLEIVRHDAPWASGFHPKQFSLYHAWYGNVKPNLMANNTLKYVKVDPRLRTERRTAWNRPRWGPVALIAGLLAAAAAPAVSAYRRKENSLPHR